MNFIDVLNTLTEDGVEFVIVGGVAARLHGSTRLTHDLDIVPKFESQSWHKLIQSIWSLGSRPRIPETKAQIENMDNIRRWMVEKHMLALSFRSPSGRAEIDILLSEADQFETLKSRAFKIEVGSRAFYVASIDDLIRMKQKAGRPQDILDIQILEKIKQQSDI